MGESIEKPMAYLGPSEDLVYVDIVEVVGSTPIGPTGAELSSCFVFSLAENHPLGPIKMGAF